MAEFYFNGEGHLIPGVYPKIEVVKESGAALPDFSIPLIIGRQMKGVPYSETEAECVRGYSQVSLLKAYFGDHCDMATAFEYFKKHGGKGCLFLGTSPTTQSSATLLDDDTPTPGDSLDITSKDWGAYTGDIAITVAAGSVDADARVFTVRPPKKVAFLTVDSGTGDTITVKTILDYKAGDTVYLTDNATAKVSKVIQSVVRETPDVDGSITFTTVIASSVTVANNARIYQEDSSLEEVSGELADFNEIINWFTDECTYIDAAQATGATIIPGAMAKTCFKDITDAVAGTSPAPTGTDYDGIEAILPAKIRDFGIRLICLVTGDETEHAAFRDFAIAQRTEGNFVQIILGGPTGVIVETAADNTNPGVRSGTINNQDVIFCAPGLDSLAPYLTAAPAILGCISGNPVNHNLTRDKIVASTIEKDWSTKAAQEYLIQKGVLTIVKGKTGFHILKGVNTLQDNLATGGWNEDPPTTWLPMQRAIVDYAVKTFLDGFNNDAIGADGISEEWIRGYAVATSDYLVNREKYLAGFRAGTIESDPVSGEGWLVTLEIQTVKENNYMGLTVQVRV